MRPFHEILANGNPIGAYLALESPYSAQLMGRAGFDWMLIDMEHSPFTAREATSIVHAIAVGSHGKTCSLVRIPSSGVEWVKWALDSGAAGIIAPMVQTRQEAESIVRFTRYPPQGQRSFGPFNAPWTDLNEDSDVPKYFTKTAKDVAVVAMIESAEGIQNAEAIISTPGISGIFIGPVDLRLSIGLTGADGQEKEYIDALKKILDLGRKHSIPIGIFSASPEIMKSQIEMGFAFFLVSGDALALQNGARTAVEGARNVFRDLKL